MYMLYANAFILNIYQGVLELQERYEVCLLSLLWLFLSITDCGRGCFQGKLKKTNQTSNFIGLVKDDFIAILPIPEFYG